MKLMNDAMFFFFFRLIPGSPWTPMPMPATAPELTALTGASSCIGLHLLSVLHQYIPNSFVIYTPNLALSASKFVVTCPADKAIL